MLDQFKHLRWQDDMKHWAEDNRYQLREGEAMRRGGGQSAGGTNHTAANNATATPVPAAPVSPIGSAGVYTVDIPQQNPNNPMQLINRFFQQLERQEREARHERKEARQERREDNHRRERQHRDDMKRRSYENEKLIRAIQAGRGSPTHKYGTIDSQIHTRRLWTRLCSNATWPA